MLPKKRRLTTALFDQIFKTGKVEHSKSFWLRHSIPKDRNTPKFSRFAVAVSKKVSPTAAERNSIKRKIYNIIGENIPRDHQGMEAIVGVKENLDNKTGDEVEKEVVSLLKKVIK